VITVNKCFDTQKIRNTVKELQGGRRYSHTLGVEEEAIALGEIFMPDKCEKLALTALLHDITKKLSVQEHMELCEKYGIDIDKNIAPKLLHAKTGCEYARELFGDGIVDEEVYTGILYHTTGRRDMTLFETIIYLADYIEKTRTFRDCIKLRKFFYKGLKKGMDKYEILRLTMVLSFDMTIKNLISEGKEIDTDTILARTYFLNNKPFKNN